MPVGPGAGKREASALACPYAQDPSGRRLIVIKKKYLFTALIAVLGYLGYKRVQAERAEQDLWAEATDPVKPRDVR